MKISQVIDVVEQFAPLARAEAWDNCGLLVGSEKRECSAVVVALDATMEVVEEAIEKKANLIVCHHPIIFDPIKSITDRTEIGRTILKAIENKIAIYSSHTPFDVVEGGINDFLAKEIGLCEIENLTQTGMGRVGVLAESVTKEQFVEIVKRALKLDVVKISADFPNKIKKVALCGGSGGSLIQDAVNSGADVFVTGDLKHNHFVDKLIPMVDVGHFDSEKQFIQIIDALISKKITTFANYIESSNPTCFR